MQFCDVFLIAMLIILTSRLIYNIGNFMDEYLC